MDIKRVIAKGMRQVLNPPALTNCRIDKSSKVCSGTQMNNSEMGRYSYCGHDCFFLNCKVNSFVSIADNCRLGGAMHPIERVSSSPVFHQGTNVLNKNFANFTLSSNKNVVINSDVWIGAGSIILSGVTIGVGSVIGAGSVVTHNVPPYEVWAGNPARKIRNRFDIDIIEALLQIKWWEWDDNDISKYSHLFNDPRRFIEKVMEDKKL